MAAGFFMVKWVLDGMRRVVIARYKQPVPMAHALSCRSQGLLTIFSWLCVQPKTALAWVIGVDCLLN